METTYSHNIAMPKSAEAYSYWPTIATLSGDELAVFFDLDDDNAYLARRVPEWIVVEVSTSEGWDRLRYLCEYQAGRLASGLQAWFHAKEWYTEQTDGLVSRQTIQVCHPNDLQEVW